MAFIELSDFKTSSKLFAKQLYYLYEQVEFTDNYYDRGNYICRGLINNASLSLINPRTLKSGGFCF